MYPQCPVQMLGAAVNDAAGNGEAKAAGVSPVAYVRAGELARAFSLGFPGGPGAACALSFSPQPQAPPSRLFKPQPLQTTCWPHLPTFTRL